MERASSTTLQGPRDDNIVPLLHLTVFLCVAMSVMLLVEKVYMAIIILVKLFRKRPGRHPERQFIWEPVHEKDQIVVQIPIFNEKKVNQLSIGVACRVSWRSDQIIIQMLDDSTDPVIKECNNSHVSQERNKGKEVMEDENERNQEEEIRATEEKEDENERNQEEEIRTTEEKEDENERNQEEEIRTTEEMKRRKRGGDERKSQAKRRKKAEGRWKRGGDTLGERKSHAKRRKIAEVNQDDEGREKRKQQCRWVRSCMAMGCAAIFTSALIYLCAANIPEEETIYLVPT